jgi:hypothetical protein
MEIGVHAMCSQSPLDHTFVAMPPQEQFLLMEALTQKQGCVGTERPRIPVFAELLPTLGDEQGLLPISQKGIE